MRAVTSKAVLPAGGETHGVWLEDGADNAHVYLAGLGSDLPGIVIGTYPGGTQAASAKGSVSLLLDKAGKCTVQYRDDKDETKSQVIDAGVAMTEINKMIASLVERAKSVA